MRSKGAPHARQVRRAPTGPDGAASTDALDAMMEWLKWTDTANPRRSEYVVGSFWVAGRPVGKGYAQVSCDSLSEDSSCTGRLTKLRVPKGAA